MGKNFIIHQGVRRYLGCLPGRPEVEGERFGAVLKAAGRDLKDRDQWKDGFDLSDSEVPVLDQLDTNGCVGFATCTAFALAWLLHEGEAKQFSPWFVWGKLGGGEQPPPNVRGV